MQLLVRLATQPTHISRRDFRELLLLKVVTIDAFDLE